jgi:hypothetical protein
MQKSWMVLANCLRKCNPAFMIEKEDGLKRIWDKWPMRADRMMRAISRNVLNF